MIDKERKPKPIIVLLIITTLVAIILSIYYNALQISESMSKPVNMQKILGEKEETKIKGKYTKKGIEIVPQLPGKIEENKGIDTLIKQLGDSDINKSMEAANRLTILGKTAIEPLIKSLNGTSLYLNGQIIFLLGRIKNREATPVLMAALKIDNAYIRRNAAEALGKIKDERAISNLAITLFDEDVMVRERSAWALGEIEAKNATGVLIDRMRDEKDGRVKSVVVNALGRIKDPRTTSLLLKELNSQANLIYKDKVVYSLGEMQDNEAIPELNRYIEKLRTYKPTGEEHIFKLQESIKLAEEAIEKIKQKQ